MILEIGYENTAGPGVAHFNALDPEYQSLGAVCTYDLQAGQMAADFAEAAWGQISDHLVARGIGPFERPSAFLSNPERLAKREQGRQVVAARWSEIVVGPESGTTAQLARRCRILEDRVNRLIRLIVSAGLQLRFAEEEE
jgi:hypothetical protein